MYLKYFPKDVAVGDLVDLTMTMTQSTLLRVYEIIELEKRPLTNAERNALDDLAKISAIVGNDVRKLKNRKVG